MLALLSTAVFGLSLAAGLPLPVWAQSSAGRSQQLPSGAKASDCIRHRKGERLAQVVSVKPVKTIRARWGFALSRFGAHRFQGEQPPAHHPVFQLPAAALGRGPVGPLAQSSPALPRTMAGTEEVTARASPPASASMSPLSLPAPACSQIYLMAGGWWQIEPCPLWLA